MENQVIKRLDMKWKLGLYHVLSGSFNIGLSKGPLTVDIEVPRDIFVPDEAHGH